MGARGGAGGARGRVQQFGVIAIYSYCCVFASGYAYIYVYMYIHTHTYIIHIYISTYIYIYICFLLFSYCWGKGGGVVGWIFFRSFRVWGVEGSESPEL